jgi:hypothetical protein
MKQIGYKSYQLDEEDIKKWAVVATKIGYAIQNTLTFHIVCVYESEEAARKACEKLNE